MQNLWPGILAYDKKWSKGWQNPKYELANQRIYHYSHDESNWYETDWYNRPHEELVSNIRMVLEQKRAEYEKDGYKFDAVVWIGESLSKYSFGVGTWGLPAINRPALNLERAWDAISLPYIKSLAYRDRVKSILKEYAPAKGRTVTLEPKAVKLIDAIAKAISIPRTRGEETVDLLENVRLLEKKDPARYRRESEEIILDHFRQTGEKTNVNGIRFNDVFCPRGIRLEVNPFKPIPHDMREGGAYAKKSENTRGINWEEDIHHRPPILRPEVFEAALKVRSTPLTISEKLKVFFGKWRHPRLVLSVE